MDPRWKHPFTSLLAGPTGCRKTVFVQKYLQHLSEMVDPLPDDVLWCYVVWQQIYNTIKRVQFMERLPDVEQ
jgi:hypothetical protein